MIFAEVKKPTSRRLRFDFSIFLLSKTLPFSKTISFLTNSVSIRSTPDIQELLMYTLLPSSTFIFISTESCIN